MQNQASYTLSKDLLHYRQSASGEGNHLRLNEEKKPQAWTAGYRGVHENQRMKLPAWQECDPFLEALAMPTQTIVVESPTGSGKTTQVPQICVHALDVNNIPGQVWLVEPRRMPARECANRLAVEMDVAVGDVVALQYRGVRLVPEEPKNARIVTMTDGILLLLLEKDPSIKDAVMVILDEVHERGPNVDLAMGMLREVMLLRPDLKVICMSATSDTETLINHFSLPPPSPKPERVFLKGQDLKIERVFLRTDAEDYGNAIIQVVYEILTSGFMPHTDILIFQTGVHECHTTFDDLQMVKRDYAGLMDAVDLYVLYRAQSEEGQKAVLQDRFDEVSGQRRRKIIIATNIAETSITFPTLCFVIDSGLSKMAVYHAKYGADELLIVPCAEDQLTQRRGRAGRKMLGISILLATKQWVDKRQPRQSAPITRVDIAPILLRLAANGKKVKEFKFLTPPSKLQLLAGCRDLRRLGFMCDGVITELGIKARQTELSPQLASILFAAPGSGIEEEIIILVAILEVGIFQKAEKGDERSRSAAVRYGHMSSDHLCLINLWREWRNRLDGAEERPFTDANRLLWSACRDILSRVKELQHLWDNMHLGRRSCLAFNQPDKRASVLSRLVRVLVKALPGQLARRIHQADDGETSKTKYRRLDNSQTEDEDVQKLLVSPHSLLRGTIAEFLVYQSLRYNSGSEKCFMHIVTSVPYEMVVELSPSLAQQ